MMTPTELMGARILIVDDHEANVRLLEHMLTASGYRSVSTLTDSRAAADAYREERHDLVLLDINMPYVSGFEVMSQLAAIETDGYVPVIAITAEPAHKQRALDSGARDFISKPFDHVEVLTRIRNILEVRLLHKQVRAHNKVLEARVRDRTEQLQNSYRETIMTMTAAAEHRDEDTGKHVQRIGLYCDELASTLGMPEEFQDQIRYASPMHDIGKIGIPDQILLKPGSFTPEEWVVMKTHTEIGARILSDKSSPYLRMGAEIALYHHERWDGGGYPNGLAGEAIPLPARLMNICDIYDALRSKRPYKAALGHAEALEIITRGDRRTRPEHFDPAILAAFAAREKTFAEIYAENAE